MHGDLDRYVARQCERTQYSCLAAKPWRDNVVVNLGSQGRHLDIAVEEVLHGLPHLRKKLDLLHYPTPHDNAVWHQHADTHGQCRGKVLGFEGPGRMIAGQRRTWLAPAG